MLQHVFVHANQLLLFQVFIVEAPNPDQDPIGNL